MSKTHSHSLFKGVVVNILNTVLNIFTRKAFYTFCIIFNLSKSTSLKIHIFLKRQTNSKTFVIFV